VSRKTNIEVGGPVKQFAGIKSIIGGDANKAAIYPQIYIHTDPVRLHELGF